MASGSGRQKIHYEAIHSDYESHYYDAQSMAFRDRYFYRPLFAGSDLNDCAVADLACGSGHNSLAILDRFPRALVTGFDISATACEDYERKVGRPCVQVDLTRAFDHDGKFKVAIIVGGLHHCVSDLPRTLINIAGLLEPGGILLMLEPNREFLLEGARRLWYRVDRYFDAATEAALAHTEILNIAAPYFTAEKLEFLGGPGYFLISQSLLFRIPKRMKRVMSPPLMVVESLANRIPIRWLHPYFVARWTRRT
jgi:SAM-dependent methyltransferase